MRKAKLIADAVCETVSEFLGRPAARKLVRNSSHEFWIFDPVFDALCQAVQPRRRGYRVGFCVDGSDGSLAFRMVHSPVMARIFRGNLLAESQHGELVWNIAGKTASIRNRDYLHFSSRKKGDVRKLLFEENERRRFLDVLKREFSPLDLFPRLPSSGKNPDEPGQVRGHDFWLHLADFEGVPLEKLEHRVRRAVSLSWPLFLALYPHTYKPRRSADLARNLKRSVSSECEVRKIKGLPKEIVEKKCSGGLEAAHIIPHAQGGSDQAKNGLRLCRSHHMLTEGMLSGSRIGKHWEKVNVSWNPEMSKRRR